MRDARLLAHLANASEFHIHLENLLIVPIQVLDYLGNPIGYRLAIINRLLLFDELHDILHGKKACIHPPELAVLAIRLIATNANYPKLENLLTLLL
jgi:hypothetical protein